MPRRAAAGSRQPEKTTPPSIRVLVVDDFADGRELVAEYLTFRGFDVHVARDGAEAIEVARRFQPEIVLMDLSMPGINGWQAAGALKKDISTQGMIVIALTAHTFKAEINAAREAGCDGVICKPFDLATLAEALPRVLKHGMTALDVPGLSLSPTAEEQRRIRPRSTESV
jgi:two-component system, cell cycle response regulator DivK